MKFIKSDMVKEIKKYSIYEVEIDLMHGDADYYEKMCISGIKEEEENLLENLITTLKLMEKEYPNGRGGGDNYNNVPGFNEWFCYEGLSNSERENLDKRIDELYRDWSYSEYGSQASLDGYKVYFFDENGKKYEVMIIQ